MLRVLHIENIAVIECCDIEFDSGFNVLTGETGAGKSIIIDALSAVLGERTSRDLVRNGEPRAVVSAMFDGLTDETLTWLSDNGFESEDDSVFIQREISVDGKNVSRLNGRPIPVSILKSLASTLLNIHGQHDSQALLNSAQHAVFIDRYTENADYNTLFMQYNTRYYKLHSLRIEKESLITDEAEKARRLEMLRYQINELTTADLKPGEIEEIAERRTILRNATKITDAVTRVLSLFNGDEERAGICGDLGGAERALYQIPDGMESVSNLASRIADLQSSAMDIAADLEDLICSFNASPEEIERIEMRYDNLQSLSRKYGNTVEEMLQFLDNAQAELEKIEFSDKRRKMLDAEINTCEEEAWQLARELQSLREHAAKAFEERVLNELSQLDMAKVRFAASVTERKSLSERGCDDIEFLIATNSGEPLKPLSKIASGGELARIMLALKNVLAEKDAVSSLVFDEVDAGVSGRAAQKVAEKLAALSRFKQILCVTHLPQMSAMADTHFKIEKSDNNGRTFTSVTPLNEKGRIEELARIIGGQTITDTTRNTAKELLTSAQQIKKELL